MIKISGFESLEKPEYARNEGRIKDVDNLNKAIETATMKYTTNELIGLFTSATIPISKVNTIAEVIEDPYVKGEILSSTDKKTGTTIYLAPLPVTTSFVKSLDKKLTFPPRFGEQNEDIYTKTLGYSKEQLEGYKTKGII
jgi:formyl-CoA transferase